MEALPCALQDQNDSAAHVPEADPTGHHGRSCRNASVRQSCFGGTILIRNISLVVLRLGLIGLYLASDLSMQVMQSRTTTHPMTPGLKHD